MSAPSGMNGVNWMRVPRGAARRQVERQENIHFSFLGAFPWRSWRLGGSYSSRDSRNLADRQRLERGGGRLGDRARVGAGLVPDDNIRIHGILYSQGIPGSHWWKSQIPIHKSQVILKSQYPNRLRCRAITCLNIGI